MKSAVNGASLLANLIVHFIFETKSNTLFLCIGG